MTTTSIAFYVDLSDKTQTDAPERVLCGNKAPEPSTYVCTRPRNHAGPHITDSCAVWQHAIRPANEHCFDVLLHGLPEGEIEDDGAENGPTTFVANQSLQAARNAAKHIAAIMPRARRADVTDHTGTVHATEHGRLFKTHADLDALVSDLEWEFPDGIDGWKIEKFLVQQSGSLCWVHRASDIMLGTTPAWEGCDGIAVQATNRNGTMIETAPFDKDLPFPEDLSASGFAAAIRPLLAAALAAGANGAEAAEEEEETTEETKKVRVVVYVGDEQFGEHTAVVPAFAAAHVASAALVQVEDPDIDGASEASEVSS